MTSKMFAFVFFQNSKVRRFAFELKMQDKSTFLLAADSEVEMEEWIGTLNKILHSSFEQAMQEKRNGDLHDGVFVCISFSVFDILFVCLSSSIICACIYLLPYSVWFSQGNILDINYSMGYRRIETGANSIKIQGEKQMQTQSCLINILCFFLSL